MIILIQMLLTAVFLLVISITDVKYFKITNKTVLPMLLIGLAVNFINGTFSDSLCGMLLPLMLFPLYALKMLGAGDIKALCAIGAVVGMRMSAITMVLTFLFGGLIAIGFMMAHRDFMSRVKYLLNWLKFCFMTRRIQTYDFGGQNGRFRFAYAIIAGAILMFANEYTHII